MSDDTITAILFSLAAIWFCCGLCNFYILNFRGMKDQTGSLGCGYTLFGPFGIIFSLFSYDRNCPSCKRGLPGTATKCHHCHTEIQPTYPPKPKERPPEPKPEPEQKKEEPKQIECAFCGGKTTDQITCEKCGRNIENQKKYL